MRWGLVPYWSKDEKIGLRTINAKAETITTAAAFREAIKYRRCLVPADAFYEWQKLDATNKQPFAIAMKDSEPYALAGLWERWKDKKARTELLTFTVITTDPNEVVEPLHDRMPVILLEKDYDPWLKPDPERPPIDLLRPFEADKMTAWRVTKAVSNVKNDTPDLLWPDNVIEMQKPLTDEELWELEGMDDRGEFDPPPPRKKRPPKPENLKFDF